MYLQERKIDRELNTAYHLKEDESKSHAQRIAYHILINPVFEFVFGLLIMVGVRDLPLRDMLSLDAWRMGLGCSGKILPSPSLSLSSPTRGVCVGGGDAETLAFAEITCSPQAAFDILSYDFGISGMRGWIRLVKRAPSNEMWAKVE